jgi:transposase
MSQPLLLELPDASDSAADTPAPPQGRGRARFQRAHRDQVEFQPYALDELLPDDHPVRAVWDFVQAADLAPLYDRIKAIEGHQGRDPVDPRILMALWLFATIEGVGSARQLDRLCGRDVVYRWICGGVSVNHRLLSEFRTRHTEWLDGQLTASVAVLMHEELVTLNRVSLDGMRVRASAGKSSFRRQPTLEEHLEIATAQVTRLRQELETDPAASDKRGTAARKRAVEEREQRVRQALVEVEKVRVQREARNRGDESVPRASTTDPQARTMKMGDGGFRPAYNVQFATAGDSLVIVGVDVNNQGSDGGLMEPMVGQIQERYAKTPNELLADGGFSSADDIEALLKHATTVYTPVRDAEKKQKKGVDPYQPLASDTPVLAEWRSRMGTEEAKAIYKERCASVECVNAQTRNRNLRQFLVRGLAKVRAVAMWHALAHNIVCGVRLRAKKTVAMAG